MKKTQILALFVCLILIAVGGISGAGEKILLNVKVPLPNDIKIIAPAEDVPKDLAAFSGAWEGKSSYSGNSVALIVEEIDSKEAKVIYCSGEQSGFYATAARCERFNAIVIPENVQIDFGHTEEARYTFRMEKNLNQVKGTYKDPLSPSKINMTKIK